MNLDYPETHDRKPESVHSEKVRELNKNIYSYIQTILPNLPQEPKSSNPSSSSEPITISNHNYIAYVTFAGLADNFSSMFVAYKPDSPNNYLVYTNQLGDEVPIFRPFDIFGFKPNGEANFKAGEYHTSPSTIRYTINPKFRDQIRRIRHQPITRRYEENPLEAEYSFPENDYYEQILAIFNDLHQQNPD